MGYTLRANAPNLFFYSHHFNAVVVFVIIIIIFIISIIYSTKIYIFLRQGNANYESEILHKMIAF